MEKLIIIPDLEVKGFDDGEYRLVEYEGPIRIGGMHAGTEQGKPVVMIGIDQDDGSILVIETTLALFLTAADALRTKYYGTSILPL